MQLLKFPETGEKDYPVAIVMKDSDVQILRNLLTHVSATDYVEEENRRECRSLQDLWQLLYDSGYRHGDPNSKLCGHITDKYK